MSAPDLETGAESFADRFVDAVIDKGTLWLLVAVVVLAVVVGIAQLVLS